MTLPIDPKFNDLFERKLLCAFTTINPNGMPHTVPVWCDYDGEYVRVNSPVGTKKARNLQTNPKLGLFILDPENGGHWIEIQGQVAEFRDETHGAREHINQLSLKYTGNPVYKDWGRASDRVMILIEATTIHGG